MEDAIRIIKTPKEDIPVNTVEFAEIKRLELRQRIGNLILSKPELARVDRMLLRWMSGVLIRAKDADHAVASWKRLANKQERDSVGAWTQRQLDEINITDEVVVQLYNEVQQYRSATEGSLDEDLALRLTDDYGHHWNDTYESSQREKRSLTKLRERGVKVSIPRKYIPLLQGDGDDKACPILDRVKNMRVAEINGFKDSKASLTIHDIFDHFWFYSKLQDAGLFTKYAEFLKRIGNPQDTDIFSREGELIASVAFDFRGVSVSESDYTPLFALEDVERIFRRSEKAGTLTDNQLRALELLMNIPADSKEARSLPFVVSGVIIELMEQRRKVGFIRDLDADFLPTRVLPMMDPEYMALIVESHHELHKPETGSDQAILHISGLIEDYLVRLSKGDVKEDEPLVINLDTIDGFDVNQSSVTQEKLEWMKVHPGFAANRRELC